MLEDFCRIRLCIGKSELLLHVPRAQARAIHDRAEGNLVLQMGQQHRACEVARSYRIKLGAWGLEHGGQFLYIACWAIGALWLRAPCSLLLAVFQHHADVSIAGLHQIIVNRDRVLESSLPCRDRLQIQRA